MLTRLLLTAVLVLSVAALRAAEPPARLTTDDLKQLFEGLGYEIKQDLSEGDHWEIRIYAQSPRRNYHVDIQTTTDGTLWMIAYLWEVPKDVGSERLAAVLSEYKIGVARFAIRHKLFTLQRAMEPERITPHNVRKALDVLLKSADDTEKLWDSKLWTEELARS